MADALVIENKLFRVTDTGKKYYRGCLEVTCGGPHGQQTVMVPHQVWRRACEHSDSLKGALNKQRNMFVLYMRKHKEWSYADIAHMLEYCCGEQVDEGTLAAKEVLEMPIAQLYLCTRSANVLERAFGNDGVVGDLLQLTERELLKQKNFGKRCLKELRETLAVHDLVLKK